MDAFIAAGLALGVGGGAVITLVVLFWRWGVRHRILEDRPHPEWLDSDPDEPAA